ncbi:MAG: hypothetical protein HWE30_18915 [Methylocystaceae bacterium]|nr:hypothetical protein [Methylocystaceae bacterium]
MSYPADLLGRAPIMRPLERQQADGWRLHRRITVGGKTQTVINVSLTGSSCENLAHISLPAAPWERGA